MQVQEVRFRGKVVGEVQDGVRFVTPRDSEKHFFRKFQGYGVSESLLKHLQAHGVQVVEFVVDRSVRFQTSVERMLAEGGLWNDAGDVQRIMPVGELVELSGLWERGLGQGLSFGYEGYSSSAGRGQEAAKPISLTLAEASPGEQLRAVREVAVRLGYRVMPLR